MPYVCHIICGTVYVYMCEWVSVCVCVCVCVCARIRAQFSGKVMLLNSKNHLGVLFLPASCVSRSLCKSYLMLPAVYRYACCYCLRKCENILFPPPKFGHTILYFLIHFSDKRMCCNRPKIDGKLSSHLGVL